MLLEMSYYSKDFRSILSGLNQLSGANGNLAKSTESLDAFWNAAERKLFGEAEQLTSPDCYMFMKKGVAVDNILEAIVKEFSVKPDFRLYRRAKLISSSQKSVELNSVFVGTIEVDVDSPYHEFLLARAREETISYGTLALYDWFNFFCSVSGGKWIELRYIAGLVRKAAPEPLFVIRKKDFSDLRHLKLFYNIVNIVESLLNLTELRMALIEPGIVVINRVSFSLHDILDELALKLCADPKRVMQKLRTALYSTVRYAGVDAENPDFLHHVAADPISGRPGSHLAFKRYDKVMTDKFRHSKILSENFDKTNETFDELKMPKLKALSIAIRSFQFIDDNGSNVTMPSDLAIACSFVLNIIRIPGFGRASKYATAPRSAPIRDDDYGGIGETFKKNIIAFHREARKDFTVTSDSNYVHRFLSFLKTTSSGMAPVDVNVTIEDAQGKRVQVVKGKKKLLTAALYGDDLLSKKMLNVKMDKLNPGRTGTRDVPGKPTRTIYPIRLPTLGAMIVPTFHIVKYVSTSTGKTPLYGCALTSDYVSSGSDATTGVRISDNLNTITSSGSSDYICIDIDMSNYDSCCVDKNFRAPFIQALREIGQMDANTERYGKDGLTWNEMIDYGFGDGYLSGTFWDAGRKPLFVLKDEFLSSLSVINKEVELTLIEVGEDIPGLRIMNGCKKLNPNSKYYVTADSTVPKDLLERFYVGYTRDGSDLLYMTSEASGELTTLAMNSIMNLSIQELLIAELKKTKFGSCLEFKTHQAVGDDITILCRFVSFDFTTEDIDFFLIEVQRLVDLYGFKISLDKTFFCYGQSEYVQTYGIRGLFIPKDQILLISSERPRRIVDPLAYLESFKRLLCTKIARGMDHAGATLIYLYVYRRLMSVDLRRHQVKRGSAQAFLCGQTHLQTVPLKVVRNKDESFGKLEDMVRFVPTIARAFLPKSCGGGGLFIHAINIVVTDVLFMRNLRDLDEKSRNFMYSCYVYFRTRYRMVPLSESSNVKIDVQSHRLFSMNSLFGDKYMQDWKILSHAIDLGRLNSENVPRNLVRKGVMMENFMIGVNFREEEIETERFVNSLSVTNTRFEYDNDEVLLNFEFEFEKFKGNPCSSFLQGLDPRFQNVITVLGTKMVPRLRQSKTDIIRRMLFREPVLNLIHGSETVISVLEKYDVNSVDDSLTGVFLLYRMGMCYSIAQAIVSAYVDSDTTHFSDDTIGACTDDLSSLFEWMTEERYNSFVVPTGISKSMKYRLFIFALQLGLIEYFRNGCRFFYIPTAAKMIDLGQIKKLKKTSLSKVIGFPRVSEYKAQQMKKKNTFRVQSALLADCITP